MNTFLRLCCRIYGVIAAFAAVVFILAVVAIGALDIELEERGALT